MAPKLALFATLFLAGAAVVQSQDATGQIFGNIKDGSGGVVVNAQVIVTSVETGIKRDLSTNTEGNYSSPKLRTGTYVVEAEMAGFKKFRRTGIVLGGGSVAEVNIVLETGDVAQTVSVEDKAPILNTTSGSVRTSIDSTFVEQAPLNGRDSNEMLKFVPGAVLPLGRAGGPASGTEYSINGVRSTSNNFTLDGTDNSDTFNSNGSRLPPPDALKEFTVQSNYSAEFGRGAGAAVIALTRSGTNDFHGSGYDYWQTDTFNANTFQRNATNAAKPEFTRHRLGLTFGGPLVIPKLYNGKNKTFFFFNHQRLITPASPYSWRRGGLTQAELEGDFSQSIVVPTVSTAAAAAPNSPFAGKAGQKITNLKPYLSPTAVKLYNYFQLPLVAKSGDMFYVNKSQSLSQPEWVGRLDQALGARNNLSFTMFWRNDAPDVKQINDSPEQLRSSDQFANQHYSFSDVWVLSPTIVNELSAGYNRLWDKRNAQFGNLDYSQLNLAYPQLDPNAFIQIGRLQPSYFSINSNNVKYEGRDGLDFRDTVSLVRGNHFMKAGAMVQFLNTMARLTYHNEYTYTGGWLNNRAAEFLIGWPNALCCVSEPFYRNARKNVDHFFFTDDWKITPRLSLNLGVRWEPQQWAYIKNNKALLFIPGARSAKYPNFPLGVVPIDDPASPSRSGRAIDWNNIAPRIGGAYRLDAAGKKVIRAGYGLFYDATDANRDGINLTSAFPFSHNYSATFNRGYPGPEGWLNIFKYQQIPTPNLQAPANPATATFDPTATYGSYVPDNNLGYTHQWNVTFEYEFRPGWSASTAYLGNRGVDLFGLAYWNVPASTGATDNYNLENMAARRPYQDYRYQTFTVNAQNASSAFDGLQLTMKARVQDFHLLTHYTFSRTLSDIDGIWGTLNRSNPNSLGVDWARSNIDHPHNYFALVTWDLPILRHSKGFAGRIIGGWQATSIFQVISGTPINVIAAQNNTFTCQSCTIRPDLTGQPLIKPGWRSDPNLVYVNAAAFSQPKDRTYGNAPRNAIRWPYTKNVDLNLAKSFRPIERVTVEFRGEFYNLFNWVNWSAPASVNLGSPNTLSMKSEWTGISRNVQLGFRLVF